jgi:hypothetical protein
MKFTKEQLIHISAEILCIVAIVGIIFESYRRLMVNIETDRTVVKELEKRVKDLENKLDESEKLHNDFYDKTREIFDIIFDRIDIRYTSHVEKSPSHINEYNGNKEKTHIQQGQPQTPIQQEQPPQTPIQQGQPQTPIQKEQPQQTPIQQGQPQTPIQKEQPQTPIQKEQPQQTPIQQGQPQTPIQKEQPPQTPIQQGQPPQAPIQQGQPPQAPIRQGQPQQTPIQKEQPPQTPSQQGQPPQTPIQQEQPQTPSQQGQPPTPGQQGQHIPKNKVSHTEKLERITSQNYGESILFGLPIDPEKKLTPILEDITNEVDLDEHLKAELDELEYDV